MSGAYFQCIERAFKSREALFKVFQIEETDCYRLFNGEPEGIPGFVVEKYGAVLVFQWHEGKCSLNFSEMGAIADFYAKNFGVQSVYLKVFVGDRSSKKADLSYYENKPLWGVESQPKIVCSEKGMKLEIHPYDGFSTGIFLDQRNNREFLRKSFSDKEVLNCFSYTCAFSVACALNHNRVTSVDLSKKYLEWGKNNFALNGLKPDDYFFYAVDVFEQFKKAKKLGKSYDLIILDPPSFSRNNQGKAFSVKRDMKELVEESCDVLNSKGVLFVSSNLATWSSVVLKKLVGEVLKSKNLKFEEVSLPQTPSDLVTVESPLSSCCFKVQG